MFLTYAASGDVPFGASLDEISEIEEALSDLASGEALGKSDPYWAKIRDRLLEFSSTQDVEHAVKEWAQDGTPWAGHGACELCDHTPITFHFPIKNRVTGKTLVVGSECVYNYLNIHGFQPREDLRRRLVAQVNLLKKKQKGQATDSDLALSNEAFDLEATVRARIAAMFGGNFDVKEYKTELSQAKQIGQILRVKGAGFEAGSNALRGCLSLIKCLEDFRKRVKSYDGYGLLDAVTAIMKMRDNEVRITQLMRLKTSISDVFAMGKPDQVISRMWDGIKDRRDALVEELAKKCNEAKAKMIDEYSDELLLVKPYSHLSFTLSAGLAAHREELENQVTEADEALHKENFFDLLLANDTQATKVLNMPFNYRITYSSKPMGLAASQICLFLDVLRKNLIGNAVKAIEVAYGITTGIKDIAGVRVALLKAADDGLTDADVSGLHAVTEFAKLLQKGDARIGNYVQAEVDEVKALAKLTGHQKVYEKMTADLGVDIEKAFRLYSSKRDFEKSFCATILEHTWPKGQGLSTAQMGNIKKQIASKSKRKEVPDSMWDFLSTALTAPYRKPS